MIRRPRMGFKYLAIVSGLILILTASQGFAARDAAFLNPGAGGNTDQAIKVEPKNDIDTGESVLGISRRTTLFFVNQTTQPIKIEKLAVNGDSNVTVETTNDDCSKQGSIAGLSRCTVELSVTPSSAGPWSVDVLLTHTGAGRIARARVTGKTAGTAAAVEKKDTGLTLNAKESNPVNFGDVEAGNKAVRSALMINDSPETISIYSIDVIESDKNLQRLEQGCAVDMELKPGESCPVTMVWTPEDRGQISTDLIIRHSGRLGFAVIPIRGTAKGEKLVKTDRPVTGLDRPNLGLAKFGSVPLPPSPQDLDQATAGKIPPVAADALGGVVSSAPDAGSTSTAPAAAPASTVIRLIGTVGNRAVLLLPDATTAVVNVGEEFELSEGRKGKLSSLTAKSAEILIDGKKKQITLGTAPELVMKVHVSGSSSSERAPASPSAEAPPPTAAGATGATGTPAPPLPSLAPLPATSTTPLTPAKSTGYGGTP